MVNPSLVDWVRRQEMKGYNSQQIYLHLINGGYDQKDVIEAINYSNSVSGSYPMPQQSVPFNQDLNHKKVNSSKSSSIGLVIFLLFIVGIGGGAYYLYYTEQYIPLFEKVGLSHLVTPQVSQDSSQNTDVSENIDNSQTIEEPSTDNSDSEVIDYGVVVPSGVVSENDTQTSNVQESSDSTQ